MKNLLSILAAMFFAGLPGCCEIRVNDYSIPEIKKEYKIHCEEWSRHGYYKECEENTSIDETRMGPYWKSLSGQ